MIRPLVAFLIAHLLSGALLAAEQRDYALMDHRVFIDHLRAGNHDESGQNDYFFTLTLKSVRNTKDDLVKDLDDRPMIAHEAQPFGDVKVAALAAWVPDGDPEEALFIDILGDKLREVVADSMRKFGVKESEVSIVAIIEMWERHKTFGYFGEDTKVAENKYFPIPASEYHAPERTNLKLTLSDATGTAVDIKIRYKTPRKSERPNSPQPSPTPTLTPTSTPQVLAPTADN